MIVPVPAVVYIEQTFQGHSAQWWAARAVKARRDANRRAAEIRRLRKRLARHLQASDLDAWTCIHRGEGAWNSATGNGYYGGLQMDLGFQRTYGPELLASKGTANNWTPAEQIMVARRARDSGRGYDPWPKTARACGLR